MVFVGGGGDREEIVAYCQDLGLTDKVFFCPAIHDRNQIRAWYCRADMFLFPSTFDTNGLVVREAAACGLASVLIAGSCAAEDVTDGVSGFLIEENSAAMAARLRQLCGHRETMKQVGCQAQQQLYISWEEAVGRAYQRYGAVIDNYRRGLYPEHERLSDDFIRAMSTSMELWDHHRDRQQARLQELRREYRELKEEMIHSRQRVKESIAQHLDRFL